MPRDDFYTPTDMDALRMENELLAFETRFLKTKQAEREAELERHTAQLQDRLEESERRLGESERSAAQLRARLAEAERAERDIVLLLRRLTNSPLGWYLGTRQNFRILEQRYLGNDD